MGKEKLEAKAKEGAAKKGLTYNQLPKGPKGFISDLDMSKPGGL